MRPSERKSTARPNLPQSRPSSGDSADGMQKGGAVKTSVGRGLAALGLQRSPVHAAFRLPLQLLRAVSPVTLDDEPEATPRPDESLWLWSFESRSFCLSLSDDPVKPLFKYDSKTQQYIRIGFSRRHSTCSGAKLELKLALKTGAVELWPTELSEEEEAAAADAALAQAAAEEEEVAAASQTEVKARYLNWLDESVAAHEDDDEVDESVAAHEDDDEVDESVAAHEDDDEVDESVAAHEDDDEVDESVAAHEDDDEVDETTQDIDKARREAEEKNIKLAEQAFEVMDESGVGQLTRMEVTRAYRLNEHVHEVMLPLLDVAADKYSLAGVNVKAQVDAFEDAFRRADRTNEASLVVTPRDTP